MITTVTMNTSLDKLYRIGRLEVGTVMRVGEVVNTAGGKGLNVAKVVSRLGEPVAATGFIGGFNGEQVRALLKATGVRDAFVDSGVETRACINVIDGETRASTEFLEPGLAVTPERYEEFLKRYAELIDISDAVTISGSLPALAPAGFYGRLVALAIAAGKPIVLDTSGQLLRDGVAAHPTLLKPNREELAQLAQREILNEADLVRALQGLFDSGIPYVAASRGAEGVVFACAEGVFKGWVPAVRAINPVGCGDSMVAAFAVGLARRLPAEEMLHLALAVSAASAMNAKTGDFDHADFEGASHRVKIKRIA